MINRENYPVSLEVQLGRECESLHDLIENKTIKVPGGCLKIEVPPYGMLCFRSDINIKIGKFNMTIPPSVVSSLIAKLDKLRTVTEAERKKTGLDIVIKQAEDALTRGAYSHLAYLLQSGPAEKVLGRTTAF